MKRLFLRIAVLVILLAGTHFIYLNHKAPKENYPDDTWLSTAQNKKALIIVAHDDDAISAAGTITGLCAAGWTVKELCFYNTVSGEKENQRIQQRQEDTKLVKQIEGLTEFNFVNTPFRNINNLKAPEYMPLTKEEFNSQYNKDSLLFYIRKFIDENNPSVIFCLDNNIGGYGNPDHIMVSRLVVEECLRRAKDSLSTVKYIYQPVFTPSMAKNILGDMPVYKAALAAYGVGMPLPDVQVDITETGAKKKEVMQAYTTEQNSIRRIWPYYQYYPASIYFRMFDREFFRIIPVKKDNPYSSLYPDLLMLAEN